MCNVPYNMLCCVHMYMYMSCVLVIWTVCKCMDVYMYMSYIHVYGICQYGVHMYNAYDTVYDTYMIIYILLLYQPLVSSKYRAIGNESDT